MRRDGEREQSVTHANAGADCNRAVEYGVESVCITQLSTAFEPSRPKATVTTLQWPVTRGRRAPHIKQQNHVHTTADGE